LCYNCRFSTMALCLLQFRLLSHIYFLSASSCRYSLLFPELMLQMSPWGTFRNPFYIYHAWPFSFAVQPGPFDLVGTIVYEIDQHPYQNTFYNGTIEVVEPGVLFSMESVFLFTLGIALLILLGLWINGQIQNLSKVIQCFLFSKK